MSITDNEIEVRSSRERLYNGRPFEYYRSIRDELKNLSISKIYLENEFKIRYFPLKSVVYIDNSDTPYEIIFYDNQDESVKVKNLTTGRYKNIKPDKEVIRYYRPEEIQYYERKTPRGRQNSSIILQLHRMVMNNIGSIQPFIDTLLNEYDVNLYNQFSNTIYARYLDRKMEYLDILESRDLSIYSLAFATNPYLYDIYEKNEELEDNREELSRIYSNM